jgi:hypothetical protein
LTCLLNSAGTEFTNRMWAARFLDRLHAERGIAAVLHIPESEALAGEWATARGLPHGPAPDDLAGVDVVAALPGPVPGRVYLNRLKLGSPDDLFKNRTLARLSQLTLGLGNFTA